MWGIPEEAKEVKAGCGEEVKACALKSSERRQIDEKNADEEFQRRLRPNFSGRTDVGIDVCSEVPQPLVRRQKDMLSLGIHTRINTEDAIFTR